MTVSMQPRLLFFHKQSTSGRTRFLRFPDGVCGFAPLPAGTRLRPTRDEDITPAPPPSAPLRAAAERLGLPADRLRTEADFRAWPDCMGEEIAVMLVQVTTVDPPFAEAETAGGRVIAITEARDLPAVELELLRRAYEHIMG